MGILDFDPLDGRYGEICCVTKNVPPQLQSNAAPATRLNFDVGFVRVLADPAARGESTVWI